MSWWLPTGAWFLGLTHIAQAALTLRTRTLYAKLPTRYLGLMDSHDTLTYSANAFKLCSPPKEPTHGR